MYERLSEIGKVFGLPGEIYSYETITIGNINSTYKVTYSRPDGTPEAYLFQRVNVNVFKSPVKIMENIDRVTTHIRERYPDQTTLHYYHTDDGRNYFLSGDEEFWRVVNYVESVTFNISDDLCVIESTGRAFGRFQTQLADMDGALLHETIPDFHNTRKRFDTLFADVERDAFGRVCEVREEIEYLASIRERAARLSDMLARGELPTRVTHNDTKCNNVLFDRVTKEPLVVIDLDTIMPGSAAYDFGDAIRFIANTAVEDEPDPSKVALDVEKFRAFSRGFIGETHGALENAEIESLVLGAFTMTAELAARFLDDYIMGDAYFRCAYPKHNLVRARCQMKLAMDIERKWDELEGEVRDVYALVKR